MSGGDLLYLILKKSFKEAIKEADRYLENFIVEYSI